MNAHKLRRMANRSEITWDEAIELRSAADEIDRLRATIERIEEKATQWAALAPADDWPSSGDMSHAFIADAGRAILVALSTQDGRCRGCGRTVPDAGTDSDYHHHSGLCQVCLNGPVRDLGDVIKYDPELEGKTGGWRG